MGQSVLGGCIPQFPRSSREGRRALQRTAIARLVATASLASSRGLEACEEKDARKVVMDGGAIASCWPESLAVEHDTCIQTPCMNRYDDLANLKVIYHGKSAVAFGA